MDRDEIINKRARRIAEDHGCTVAEVNEVLDRHPVELDRDTYLKRTLALELLRLDELEEAFREKALMDRDVAAGVLLVKVDERRARRFSPSDADAFPRVGVRAHSRFDCEVAHTRERPRIA